MSILSAIALFFLIWSIRDWEKIRDFKDEERRHKEKMDADEQHHKELQEELRAIRKGQKRVVSDTYTEQKRYIKDSNGNILAEEIITQRPIVQDTDDEEDIYEDEEEDDYYDDYYED